MKQPKKDEIMDRLIALNYNKSYFKFIFNKTLNEMSDDDKSFLNDNDFIFVVTEDTKGAGYAFDAEKVAKLLEVGEEYTLDFMNVSQTSTSIRLKEFPNDMFNSANFEVLKVIPKSDGKK